MLLNDSGQIIQGDPPIPTPVGIDQHISGKTMATHMAGAINSDLIHQMMLGQQSLETLDQRWSTVTAALVTPSMNANKNVVTGKGLVAETVDQPVTHQMIFDKGRQIGLLHSAIAHRIRKHKDVMACTWAAAGIITSCYLDLERHLGSPSLNRFREGLQKPTIRFNPLRPIRPPRADE
jgi:hypothetical protein